MGPVDPVRDTIMQTTTEKVRDAVEKSENYTLEGAHDGYVCVTANPHELPIKSVNVSGGIIGERVTDVLARHNWVIIRFDAESENRVRIWFGHPDYVADNT